MEKFEFKSAICTSRSQSERLLKLGLKKETADMVWMKELAWDEVAHCTYDAETYILRPIDYLEGESHRGHIPAWSLHRLLSLLPTEIKCDVENGLGIYLGSQNGVSYFGVLGYYSCENLYDAVILCIEDVIKEGYFNQDYLEEK